jgi:hypothetical protein
MCGVCGMYEGQERVHLEDLRIGGMLLVKLVLKKWHEMRDMDWIDLAQVTDGWRGLLLAVMNPWVPNNAGTFLSS